jgi:sarcosine oxidase subunit beta
MRNRAEIVIVGAGIIGCSIAYFLAKKGHKDIIVIDKKGIASGMTGLCPGGVRLQWGTEINCLMAKESAHFYTHMNDELQPEYPLAFRKVGYLYLFNEEKAIENYKQRIALQNQLGIPTKLLQHQEIQEIVPGLNPDSYTAGSFCPDDGFVDDVYDITNGFANAAKRMGVKFLLDEVGEIITERDRIRGVKTGRGIIESDIVVNAAGLDSPDLASTVGVELPIKSEVRRLIFTNRIEERLLEPLLVYFEKGFAAKQLTDGTLYLSYLGKDIQPPCDHFEYQMRAAEVGMEIFPPLEKVEFRRHVDGIYDSTPDHQAILGGIDGLVGYYQAVGMSGHGFMMAPAIARAMAETIAGEEPFIDISPLHYNRFAKNKLIPEPAVV